MWKYKDKSIRPGKSWTDDNGILHPGNWDIWSAEHKDSMGIVEIIPETPPDSRLYTWSMNKDGTINSKAKELDDSGEVLGVKSSLKNAVKKQQGALLAQTDWVVIRKADIDKEVPANIKTWRDAIRAKATEMENAIDAASSVDDIVKLWITHKVDDVGRVVKSGILYDWPELQE
jgi:hypothetical protein|tara:strand:+ start:103 stop:624 length:522 start_codon:yes stop_codon:yes gene_type:complete